MPDPRTARNLSPPAVMQKEPQQNVLHQWLRWRRSGLLVARVFKLLRRYGVTSSRMNAILQDYASLLLRYQSPATFPTTAVTLQRHPEVMRRLTDSGIELAIHGYVHIDYSKLDFRTQCKHLAAARKIFEAAGLRPAGMRCPYLWWNSDTRNAAIENGLSYVSNQVYIWEGFDSPAVRSLYHYGGGMPAQSLPFSQGGIIEMPISLPDDFILAERMDLDPGKITSVWEGMLESAVRKNEMLVLQLHPELLPPCASGLESLLQYAVSNPGDVWRSSLRDAAQWWEKRCRFDVSCAARAEGMAIERQDDPDAVLLVRNLPDADYQPFDRGPAVLPGSRRPFVALPLDAPDSALTIIKEEGYITRKTAQPEQYSASLSSALLAREGRERWVSEIEQTRFPILKYARWPRNRRCALIVTGDLDCVTLVDYAWRLAGR